ncbi:MAG: 50S ribosomal protein L29 [Thermodesulfobacteriota bacterium]
MIAKDIRSLSVEEMKTKLIELEEAYFNLRFRHETGQLEKTSALKQARKDIARVKTELSRNINP